MGPGWSRLPRRSHLVPTHFPKCGGEQQNDAVPSLSLMSSTLGGKREDLPVPPPLDQKRLGPAPGALKNSVAFMRAAPNTSSFSLHSLALGCHLLFFFNKINHQLNQLFFVETEHGQNNMLLNPFDLAPPVCSCLLQVGPSVCPPAPGQTPPGQPMSCNPCPCF